MRRRELCTPRRASRAVGSSLFTSVKHSRRADGGTGARFGLCRDVDGGERSDGSREMKCSGLEGWW